ncbi:endogenous retrovirus group K member 8 Rec protein [Macaca thibetana thibetana]|uniref:endogenous retrovirus group K member 8 Rec protein n=1 Tax=Macaca thibetana thibetana TaxID=257877 RepID=UPI0021BC742A|nr:endogenous retrovirus group K member 8 Rec protein [Macaca thibetana thibetana]
MNPSEMQRKAPPWRQKHHNRAPSTHKMNKMVMSEEQIKLPSTKKVELLTWAQLKKLTELAKKKPREHKGDTYSREYAPCSFDDCINGVCRCTQQLRRDSDHPE